MALLVLWPLLLWAPRLVANGRFPNASHVVVGPGAQADVIALRTTFGLLISRDGGANFYWLCEDAMFLPSGAAPTADPAVEMMSDGSVHFGFERGIHSTVTGCRVDLHPEVDGQFIADLSATPSGEEVFAVQANAGAYNHVLRADRSSGRYESLGRGVPSMVFSTIEVAPSDPRRVYAAGRDEVTRAPRLYRSDDGGETLNLQSPRLGLAEDIWISGVDPTDPEVLYIRATVGLGTWLLKSRDGGASVERVASTSDAMLGFAIGDDGRAVWAGSLNDGLLRSDDGGETFAVVNPAEVLCLRQHAGVLWVCANWLRTGYALGRSSDRGRSFQGVLRFDEVVGPYSCAMPSEGQAYCAQSWPSQREMLAAAALVPGASARDGAAVDATELDASRGDSGAVDGGADARVSDAAVGSVASGGGLCMASPGRALGATRVWLLFWGVWLLSRGRRV